MKMGLKIKLGGNQEVRRPTEKWYFPGLNATFKWLFWIFWRDFWVFWAYKRLKPGNLNCKPPQGASSSTFRGLQPRVGPENSKIEARKVKKSHEKQRTDQEDAFLVKGCSYRARLYFSLFNSQIFLQFSHICIKIHGPTYLKAIW